MSVSTSFQVLGYQTDIGAVIRERSLTKYKAKKNETVTTINGQNPKKNVPPIVSKSLARGINP